MRTVHETEALRPSDPVPRGHTGGISNGATNGSGTLKRIKLVMGSAADKKNSVISELPPLPMRQDLPSRVKHEDATANGPTDPMTTDPTEEEDEESLAIDIDTLPFTLPVAADYYPPDIAAQMDESDLALPPSQYFRLLRRQIHWAERESASLATELDDVRATIEDASGKLTRGIGPGDEKSADRRRKVDWIVTEALLDDLLKAQVQRAWDSVRDGDEDGLRAAAADDGGGADPAADIWKVFRDATHKVNRKGVALVEELR